MQKPLDKMMVLDFTRLFAGPFCTMLLGDLGAEVIKIEEPPLGDPTRDQGPPFHFGYGMSFWAGNRNKKSVVLDMRKEPGRKIARMLADKADILVENFRPGVMEKLGLGFQSLFRTNPKIIYASLSGFGADGPLKDRAAFDLTIQAEGGYMSITGERGGTPIKLGTSAFDLVCGIYAKGAILASLLQRSRDGKGQHIETSLLEAELTFLVNAGMEYLLTGKNPVKWGSEHAQVVPYKAFKTKDGWIIIGAAVQKLFEGFLGVLKREDLLKDERFAAHNSRVANRDALYEILDAEVKKYTTEDLLKRLNEAGVACSPVKNLSEVFSSPQVLHRGMLKYLHHDAYGQVPTIGPAVKYSGFDVADNWSAPPVLGEHTGLVLRTVLKMGEEEISALRREKVIFFPSA